MAAQIKNALTSLLLSALIYPFQHKTQKDRDSQYKTDRNDDFVEKSTKNC